MWCLAANGCGFLARLHAHPPYLPLIGGGRDAMASALMSHRTGYVRGPADDAHPQGAIPAFAPHNSGLLAVIPDIGGKLPAAPHLFPDYHIFAGELLGRRPPGR